MRGLPRKAKGALEKARDSALLAVEVYNKPAVKFKSGGYITLMVIAWTALFHAIFFKKKRKPFRKEHGRFLRIENDFMHWELGECLDKVSFLSFNYDLLIDNSVRTALNTEPDYAVSFRSIQNAMPLAAGVKQPLLLKIHGSLNWLYCPTCNQLDCFAGEKIVAQIAHDPMPITCNVCQEPRVPILIPPTFFKVMSNFYLQQIWRKTEEMLREADHVIFCGYSFPDADIHFKYLLKRAEINKPEFSPKHLEVFIINEHPGKSSQQRDDEKNRFLRFFREKGLVRWTKLSFSDFAANPAAYADSTNWI